MGADPTAFAVLGLEPGASAADVERAYKRLIKEHHPDRSGGDAARASELNRAYHQLRSALRAESQFSLHPNIARRSPGWSRTVWAAILLLVLAGAAAILALLPLPAAFETAISNSVARPTHSERDIMSRPLNLDEIDSAVVEAVRVSKASDEMRLTALSRQCHSNFRMKPELGQFDRCAAFDDAVIRLQDRDPLRDRGPFSQIAVSGRHWSAAAYLSGDYLATDSRLQRIRTRVDVLLAPERAIAEAN